MRMRSSYCRVTAVLAARRPALGAVLSVARGLSWERFAGLAERAGWQVRTQRDESIPFVLSRDGREIVRAWSGSLGPVLRRVALVLGQAGTANEAAAAAGVPVVAFERDGGRKMRWYRRRQRGLLGDALAVFSGRLDDAVSRRRAHSLRSGAAPTDGRDGTRANGRAGRGGAHRAAHRIVDRRGTVRRLMPAALALMYAIVPLLPSFIALTGVAFPGVSLVPRGLTYAVLALCALLAVYAISLLVRYRAPGTQPLLLPFLSVFGAGLLADVVGFDPSSGLLFTFIGGMPIVWQASIARFYGDRNVATTLFWGYLISGGVAAAAAIAMVALRFPPLQYAITHGRATGTFVLPGELAGYLIVLLPVAYVLGRVGRTQALRAVSWIVLAIGIVALAMTYSRAGWMGFAAAVAFLVAVRTRHGAGGAAAVIAAGVVGGSRTLQRAPQSERGLHAPRDLEGGAGHHRSLSFDRRGTVQLLASLRGRARPGCRRNRVPRALTLSHLSCRVRHRRDLHDRLDDMALYFGTSQPPGASAGACERS